MRTTKQLEQACDLGFHHQEDSCWKAPAAPRNPEREPFGGHPALLPALLAKSFRIPELTVAALTVTATADIDMST